MDDSSELNRSLGLAEVGGRCTCGSGKTDGGAGHPSPFDLRGPKPTAGSGSSTTGDTCTTFAPSETSLSDDEDGPSRLDAHPLASISEAPLDDDRDHDDASLPAEVTTMELAIGTGDPGLVASFLHSLDKTSAASQLTGCYGGRYLEVEGRGAQRDANEHGLVPMTTPLLHAARTGSTAMFTAVFSAMRDRLWAKQVKIALLARDAWLRSVLSMALAGGSKYVFDAALDAAESVLSANEMKELITAREANGDGLLHRAADSGHMDVFGAVLGALGSRLSREEMNELLVPADDRLCGERRTVFHSAAASGSGETFQAVLAGARAYTTRQEVSAAIVRLGEGARQSVLHAAIASGNVGAFEGVLAALRGCLAGHELKSFVSDDPPTFLGWSVHLAAGCETAGMFEAVLAMLDHELGPEKVKERMSVADKNHGSLLHSAIGSGRSAVFRTVLDAVKRRLSPEEVQKLLTMPTRIHGTVLQSAVATGATEVFDAVLAAARERLAPEQVKAMMRYRKGRSVVTILHSAAKRCNISIFERVLATLELELTADEIEAMLLSTRHGGAMSGEAVKANVLHSAVDSRSKGTFEGVLAALRARLTGEEVKEILLSRGGGDESIIQCAARSGDKGVFEAVLAALAAHLTHEEVTELILSPENNALDRLLEQAAGSGSIELWQRVMEEVGRRLPAEQAGGRLVLQDDLSRRLLRMVAFQGNVGMWNAVLKELLLQPAKVREVLLSEGGQPGTALRQAAASRDPATVRAVLHCFRGETLSREDSSTELGKFIAAGFSRCTSVLLGSASGDAPPAPETGSAWLGWAVEVYSGLLQSVPGTLLDPEDLVRLSRKQSGEWLRACFVETLVSADNPFVPGMTLSVTLGGAASGAPEGERKKLRSLQRAVDSLLLEVLERLPQTVRAFHGGMAGCCRIFEPGSPSPSAAASRSSPLGPLRMALRDRRLVERFLTRPLLLDLQARRFTHGLPGPMDARNVIRDPEELEGLAGGGASRFVRDATGGGGSGGGGPPAYHRNPEEDARHRHFLLLDFRDRLVTPAPFLLLGRGKILDALLSPCLMLQGASLGCFGMPELTLSRGTQFLVAGLAAMPDQYFRVPAMRLLLDLAAYAVMLAAFCGTVLFHADGPLTNGEIAFSASFVLAGAVAELQEMRRGFSAYTADRWNTLDLLGLTLVAGGFIARSVDEAGPWGRALYALSAPLLFSRLLYFAQFLRVSGPIIQVFLAVMEELIKFTALGWVVMLGFAMSFQALSDDEESFGETCLHLFKGVLGDVSFFDDFSGGGGHDAVATVLFCLFLAVVGVMLLNLLIAVLSTSHSRVERRADLEFKVSQALLIERYRLVVDQNLLPPPFNLLQLAFASLAVSFSKRGPGRRAAGSRAKQAVGRLAFWLVLGPVAVIVGAILWVVSAPHAPFAWRRHYRGVLKDGGDVKWLSGSARAVRYVVLVAWCLVGAPVLLSAFWLTAPLKWMSAEPWGWLWDRRHPASRPRRLKPMTTDEMLSRSGGGGLATTRAIQTYLEDPLGGVEVRESEKTKNATMEHLKLLRDRIDKTLDAFERRQRGTMGRVERELAVVAGSLDAALRRAERQAAKAETPCSHRIEQGLAGL